MGPANKTIRTPLLVWSLLVWGGLLLGQRPGISQAADPSATRLSALAGRVSQSGLTTASETYDAGESLQIGTREVRLLRSQRKVAVIYAPTTGIQIAAQPEQIQTADRLYRFERQIGKPAVSVFQTRKFASADEQSRAMSQLKLQTAAQEVVPVYIHSESGLEMIPTGKIVVQLKGADDWAGLSDINRRLGTSIDRRIRGTADQYILLAPHSTARQLFDLCTALQREPAVEWAEPDFIGQVVRQSTPNDPYFPEQWNLKDIHVPQAWDIVKGSDQIIVAFLDDGMDLKHEDLVGALPSNTGEIPGNGIDDDDNGWIDDADGWNWHDNDNNPNPGYVYDNHGTQVAGVIAATGNNGKGVAGCAYGCKLMPLKVLEGDPREEKEDVINWAIAEALYYAAGRTSDGHHRWRGADVISISLGFSETNMVNAALKFAVQEGRDGKGCPTFCASGNSASGWSPFRLFGLEPGTHHYLWEFVRGPNGSAGDNTCWIDSIQWPDGTAQMLHGPALPAGWKTGGDACWTLVGNDAQGNHAMTGWQGSSGCALRPGPLDHWARSFLDVKRTGPGGYVDFSAWMSCFESYPCLVGDSFVTSMDLYPFSVLGAGQGRRTQFICLRDELGWDRLTPLPRRVLKFAEFQIVYAQPQRLGALTIRLKQIAAGRDRYDTATFDEAGWTTVFDAIDVPLNTGASFVAPDGTPINLVRFNFTREFPYDPNCNLAVDISMKETRSGIVGGLCLTSLTTETRTIEGQEYYSSGPRPGWTAVPPQLSNWIPMMWLGSGDEMRFFVDGVLATKGSGVAQSQPGLSYPASNQYTLAVGACTNFGQRSDYSQYGPKLDFLAPSSGGTQYVYTTDRTGLQGDAADDYNPYFSGTSAATPLASGVAALMLSRNEHLTATQIRTIMQQTCQQIGDDPYVNGRNDHCGYGRIDARAAVAAAAISQ